MSFGARHRAAMNPMPLTSRNSSVKMMISVMWSLIRGTSRRRRLVRPNGRGTPGTGHPVDERRGHHADDDEQELQPAEGREAPQPRRLEVVERSEHGQHDRD